MKQIWIAAEDPATAAQFSPGSSQDFTDVFDNASDADWSTVTSELSVFKIYAQWVLSATDEQLKTMISWLNDHHVALALEAGVLPVAGNSNIGLGVEGYNGAVCYEVFRLHQLGANLQYLAMDEPYYFGSQWTGPNSANLPVDQIAQQVATVVAQLKAVYPNLQVGDIEPVPFTQNISAWLDAYKNATGENLAFFHADVVWQSNYKPSLQELSSDLSSRNINYGVIYNGTPTDTTDSSWVNDAVANYTTVEQDPTISPNDSVIFQTWMANPTHLLPESMPGTLTNLILSYIDYVAATNSTSSENKLTTNIPGQQASTAISTLFSTGVNSLGLPVTNGKADAHYILKSGPDGVGSIADFTSVGVYPSSAPYLGENANSTWLAPSSAQTVSPTGSYTYETTFDLTGLAPDSASIAGQFAAGGSAEVFLNGSDTGISALPISQETSFTITTGFVSGVNTLDFVVNNSVGSWSATALRVEMTGLADMDQSTPANALPSSTADAVPSLGNVAPAKPALSVEPSIDPPTDVAPINALPSSTADAVPSLGNVAPAKPALSVEPSIDPPTDVAPINALPSSAADAVPSLGNVVPAKSALSVEPSIDDPPTGVAPISVSLEAVPTSISTPPVDELVLSSNAAVAPDPTSIPTLASLALDGLPSASFVTPAPTAGADTSQGFQNAPLPAITTSSPDPLFDAAYYLAQNPDVAAAGVDPYTHYMTIGWKEGRNPSALFNTNYYLNQNPDVKAAGVNPLTHFETNGWKEGRDPSIAFSDSKYLAAYPDVKAAGIDPLLSYVTSGQAAGRTAFAATPHATGPQDPLVDAAYVYAHNPAVAAAGLDASAWYNSVGWQQGANPDAYFDTNYYLTQNPDVKAAGIDPLSHFETNGWKEGRQPSLLFDDAKYLTANPDVKAAGLDPLQHYETNGQFEGRATFLTGGTGTADPLVNAAYYDAQLGATLIPTGTAAAQQAQFSYDSTGWKAGLNPDAFFNTAYYLSHNPDVAAAHIDPLLHYETNGWKEGRDPSALFSTNKYLAANPDVKAAGIDPLLHYIINGQAEGRTPFETIPSFI